MIEESVEELMGFDPPSDLDFPVEDVRHTLNGVSVSWLMQAFRMDRQTIKRKLAVLQPVRMERGNSPVYDFVQAASYLVKPQVDVASYIKSMRPQDLPPLLQKEYWDAKLKRQKWERAAGELWHTEDVVRVLGDVFKMLKTTMTLWVDGLDRTSPLSDSQRKVLTQMVDALQDQLYRNLVELSDAGDTRSSLADLDGEETPGLEDESDV